MRSLWIAGFQLRLPTLFCVPWFLADLLAILLCLQQISAANGDSIAYEDHNHPRLQKLSQALALRREVGNYESDFIGFDRSIIGRAVGEDQHLANNAPGKLNIEPESTQFWTFSKESLNGPKALSTQGLPSSPLTNVVLATPDSPDERILYISLTTCIQPTPKTSSQGGLPGQLELYVSKSSGNTQPNAADKDYTVAIVEGFGSLKISVKGDVYFGVSAPGNKDFTGVYSYQLTASIDRFYASNFTEPNANFIDSDTSSALIYTNGTTIDNSSTTNFKQWMDRPPPFSIFVQNVDNPSIQGMRRSVCALQNFADARSPADMDAGMTSAGDGRPKQQVHVRNLNTSSTYYAITAMIGNSTDSGNGVVGGGGIVWGSGPTFRTKSGMLFGDNLSTHTDRTCLDNNCALLFNLTFCTSVAYSAPANFTHFPNVKVLGQKYDDYAKDQYTNFSRSLQQIPCNTTSSAQYSLARTCDDCDGAYREWLCAVTIPRCEDYSNPASYLQPRAVNQSFANATLAAQAANDPAFQAQNRSRVAFANSRNPMIDSDIQPGPYKEVLPCSDLCYNLVQSCPAALQFGCPLENHGLNYTYGTQDRSTLDTTCNSPRAGISIGAASALKRLGTSTAWVAFGVALVVMDV